MDPAIQRQILETVDNLTRKEVLPRAADIDRTGEFPRDLYRAAAELGLFGLWIPEEYGGTGPDLMTPLLISERLARASRDWCPPVHRHGEWPAPPLCHSRSDQFAFWGDTNPNEFVGRANPFVLFRTGASHWQWQTHG